MIDVDVYNSETGEHWYVHVEKVDYAYRYTIDVDKDGKSYQMDGTIYNVDTLSSLELVQIVLNAANWKDVE